MNNGKIQIVINGEDLSHYGFVGLGNDIFMTVMAFSQKIFGDEILGKKSYDLILYEAVKNAVDAILDNWHGKKDTFHQGMIQIKFFLDDKNRKIRLLIRDNGAGIYASTSEQKNKGVYFGGRGVAETGIKNDVKKYKRKSTKIGTITEIQLSI